MAKKRIRLDKPISGFMTEEMKASRKYTQVEYDLAKVEEIVEVRVQVKITYQPKEGARDNALRSISMRQSTFGTSTEFGSYEVESLAHVIVDSKDQGVIVGKPDAQQSQSKGNDHCTAKTAAR